jgi:hypothetical protein
VPGAEPARPARAPPRTPPTPRRPVHRATRTCTRLARRQTVEKGACSARVSPPRNCLLFPPLALRPPARRAAAHPTRRISPPPLDPPQTRRARRAPRESAEKRARPPLEATLTGLCRLHPPQRAVQPRFRGAAPRSRRAPRQSSVHARQRVQHADAGAAVRRRNSRGGGSEATKAVRSRPEKT